MIAKTGNFRKPSAPALALLLIAASFLLGHGAATGSSTSERIERPSRSAVGGEGTSSAENAASEPDCIICHQREALSREVVQSWRRSAHQTAGIACGDCHNRHESDLQPAPASTLCLACHALPANHVEVGDVNLAAGCLECHAAQVHTVP